MEVSHETAYTMEVTHESGRRTTIVFEVDGRTIRATWAQPHSQSYRPETIQDIILRHEAGDTFATVEYRYLTFNYKLTVSSLPIRPAALSGF